MLGVAFRACGLTIMASVATGCFFGGGPDSLRDFEPPPEGASPAAAFWEQMAGLSAEESDPGAWLEFTPGSVWSTGTGKQDSKSDHQAASPRGGEFSLFLLPTWFSAQFTRVDANRTTVDHMSGRLLNPGFLTLPTLPLWIEFEQHRFTADGGSMENSALWTPIYAGSTTRDWPADRSRVSATGVPLFYGNLKVDLVPAAIEVDIHNFLWSLGPLYASLTHREDHGLEDGYAFFPLLFAGLGKYLWMSVENHEHGEDLLAHGPLSGLLGYHFRVERRIPDSAEDQRQAVADGVPSSERRLIIGGIPWAEYEDKDAQGEVIDARYGPLWGLFGTGRSDGQPCLRVFWYPIKY